MDELADNLAIGRRNLERRLKKSFETSRKNINEVMYDVGYTDRKTFRIPLGRLWVIPD
ncbi:MAG: hypothetical protein QM669_02495 [Siphonobacter sp.]